jgi:hypothetical protein
MVGGMGAFCSPGIRGVLLIDLIFIFFLCRVEELYGGMQAASNSASPSSVPLEPIVAEQIYSVGEQCLVEGLY